MVNRIKISKSKQLKSGQCLTLDVEHDAKIFEIIVVCYAQDKLAVYLNQCPHTGVNLNWQANQCFDVTEEYLACSVHGALFQPADGLCIYGPCRGQSLKPLAFELDNGELFITPVSL